MTTTTITHEPDGSVTMCVPTQSPVAAALGAMGAYDGMVNDGAGHRFSVDPNFLIDDEKDTITFWLRPLANPTAPAEQAPVAAE